MQTEVGAIIRNRLCYNTPIPLQKRSVENRTGRTGPQYYKTFQHT